MKTRNITKEKLEFYKVCPKCGKEIKGTSDSMVQFNIKVHQKSKECKEKKK